MRSSAVIPRAVLLAVLVSGCAANYNYRDMVADVGYSGKNTVSVAVHDQRDYVLSGKKRPSFVGLARGGFGNPQSRSTLSGQPLADDMSAVIAASLATKGYQAVSVNVACSDSAATVLDALEATGADKLILMTLKEWKTDLNPYKDVTLFYDLRLVVHDEGGKTTAERTISGTDNLGGDFWGPAAYARRVAPEAFKRKMEELLNSPDIAEALK